jgi:hypothetical protein
MENRLDAKFFPRKQVSGANGEYVNKHLLELGEPSSKIALTAVSQTTTSRSLKVRVI